VDELQQQLKKALIEAKDKKGSALTVNECIPFKGSC
jgi:hypothetical protein